MLRILTTYFFTFAFLFFKEFWNPTSLQFIFLCKNFETLLSYISSFNVRILKTYFLTFYFFQSKDFETLRPYISFFFRCEKFENLHLFERRQM